MHRAVKDRHLAALKLPTIIGWHREENVAWEIVHAALSVAMLERQQSRRRQRVEMDKIKPASGLEVAGIARFLGGRRIWRRPPTTKLEFHDQIRRGLPKRVLIYLLKHTELLPPDKVAHVLGMSQRTLLLPVRLRSARLTREVSNRVWKTAKILYCAEKVLGGRRAAQRWLLSPAMSLEQCLPLDLMATPIGAEIVEQLLRAARSVHGMGARGF